MNDREKFERQVLREAGQLAADAEARIASFRVQIAEL
jgi:hypothetical protein